MEELRPLSDDERLEWLRLIRSENIGPVTFRQLMDRFGDAGSAIAAIPELARRGGARRTIRVRPQSAAKKEMAALVKLGGRMIAYCEPDYPRALAHIPDAPPVISVLGHPHLMDGIVIAMVGARNGSANGIRFTESLARGLAEAGLIVVSGMARGIDAAAHRGSIDSGTIAIMAGGVDIVYPKENQALYEDIAARGLLISEHLLGMQPQARHFPSRNRIVSGLAVATIVIEATLRSGSLITARLAGEQGREVLAVPGNPLDPRARGTNKLIREGAVLVECADDVLEALAGMGTPNRLTEPSASPFSFDHGTNDPGEAALAEARERVISLLGPDPVPVDEMLRKSSIPPAHVALILLELELAGRLQRHAGGQVSLAFD
ncbi:MAG: DNA-processing protein DprA [Alphaproteobacteria bacterium]|nr:DNA-processing protein DprA [Alphaproteobacteria bacterium]